MSRNGGFPHHDDACRYTSISTYYDITVYRSIRRFFVLSFSVILQEVIITKSKPYTKEEIDKLRELFDVYIKTVIDVKKKVCSAGCARHFESEKILLEQGSSQPNLWGGGVDLETKIIDCNSIINIRPNQGNTSNEIQDANIREEFERLTKFFFSEVL